MGQSQDWGEGRKRETGVGTVLQGMVLQGTVLQGTVFQTRGSAQCRIRAEFPLRGALSVCPDGTCSL